MRRDRQFGAERMQLFQIETQHAARLQPQRAAHHISRDERIAVAVAADPASHLQERRESRPRAAVALVEPVFQRAMQPRHLAQEGVVVERQDRSATSSSTVSLVRRSRLVCHSVSTARRNCSSLASTSSAVSWTRSRRSSRSAISISRSIVLLRRTSVGCAVSTGLTNALPKNCRKSADADAGGLRACASVCGQCSARGAPPAAVVRAHLADVVLVFGDIGEMREIAEGADDAHGLGDRHAVEDRFELAPRRPVVVAMEPDRGLPDALDQVEHVGAFLVAHGIAEDTSEQPDVVPAAGRRAWASSARLERISASEGMTGGTWLGSPEAPGGPELQVFCRSAR